ncbi:hypothetical protein JCM19992_30910 [Thermostilla marina]
MLAAAAFSTAVPAFAQITETSDELIAILQSADADLHAKAVACKKLAVVGDAKAVPVLAELLTDPKLSHYARFGLEPNPSPTADEALRAALDKVDGRLLAGVVNSIGVRKDAGAIDKLKELSTSDDAQVVSATAHALAQIATAESADVLKEMLAATNPTTRAASADGALMAAERLAEKGDTPAALDLLKAVEEADVPEYCLVAATQGLIVYGGDAGLEVLAEQLASTEKHFFRVGLKAARLVGTDASKVVQAQLDKESGTRALVLLATLAEIDPDAALPIVRSVADNGEKENRLDALRLLAAIGKPEDLPIMLKAAQSDDEDLARVGYESLVTIRGAEIDRAIIAGLQQAEGKTRLMLLKAAGDRYLTQAADAIVPLLSSKDDETRHAAIQAAGTTFEAPQLPKLIALLTSTQNSEERDLIKESLRNAVRRMPSPDACSELLIGTMADASDDAKVEILELLAAVGGEKALQAVAEAANSDNETLKDAGTRLLGEWMSAEAADELLAIAKADPRGKYGIRCLRGYIRIARQLNVPPRERLAMCKAALEVAARDDERILVLDVLQRNPSKATLDLACDIMEDHASLADQAAATAVAIGETVIRSDAKAVAAAMDRVLGATKNPQTAAKAKALKAKAGG